MNVGHATLPESCPVCMHSPLSADDCKPNKALRLTVKAFLKNEEKKRDKTEAAAAAPKLATPTPITETPIVTSTATIEAPPETAGEGVLNAAAGSVADMTADSGHLQVDQTQAQEVGCV